jgi:polysaccharide pyruvyl transferase WcaK-like protein
VADLWIKGEGGKGAARFINELITSDAVIFNAEGSTYKNNIGATKALFMLWLAKTRFNKKSFFLNGSVTLTTVDSVLPAMVRKTFKVIIDHVGVREPISYRSIVDYYPDLKEGISVYPDSVFALDVDQSNPSKVSDTFSEPYFAFSLSMLPMDFERTKDKSLLVDLLLKLKELVPNVVFLAKDIEDQRLKEISQYVNASFMGPQFDYKDVMNVLSRSSFLLSGRYHHLIFASKVGCPIIPMRTASHKIDGLSELFQGLSPRPIDPTHLRESLQFLSSAEHIIAGAGELRNRHKAQAAKLGEQSLHQGRVISDILHTL